MGRRLGQHFLTDPRILDRIVEAIRPDRRDVVIEIGAGAGSLTRRLVPRVGRVIAIERDRALVSRVTHEWAPTRERAQEGYLPANLTLVAADALNCDWHALVADPSDPSRTPPFKVVGNIPYAITSPLIEKALEPPAPALVVFLVQRDVAERVAAHPASKSYGALSVGVQAVASVERLFAVKAGSFSPPPRVESALLRLVPLVKPLISAAERTNFRRFVTTLFSQRRKQLQRILRSALGMTRSEVDRVVSELALDPACRPEVLAPEELVRLFRATGR